MNDILLTVHKKAVYKAIDDVSKQQRELVKVDKYTSKAELSRAISKVSNLLGIIDTLQGLGLLDDITYQRLIWDNVQLDGKIRLLIREKKSTQQTANLVERTVNNSKS